MIYTNIIKIIMNEKLVENHQVRKVVLGGMHILLNYHFAP